MTPPPVPPVRILVLEHDPTDPLLRLADWLVEAGAVLTVLRPYAGDPIPALSKTPTDPTETADFDALISLGGEMGAHDDEAAPWLPATRTLLAAAVAQRHADPGHLPGRPTAGRGHRREGRTRRGRTGDRRLPDGETRCGPRRSAVRRAADDPGRHALPPGRHLRAAAAGRAVAVRDGLPASGVPGRRGGLGAAVPHRTDRRARPRVGAGRGRPRHRQTRSDAGRRRGDDGLRLAGVRAPVRRVRRRPGSRTGPPTEPPTAQRPDRRPAASGYPSSRARRDQARRPHPGPVRAAHHRPGAQRPRGDRAVHRRRAQPPGARTSSPPSPDRAARSTRCRVWPGSSRSALVGPTSTCWRRCALIRASAVG